MDKRGAELAYHEFDQLGPKVHLRLHERKKNNPPQDHR
jgi:hypothetical protein